MMFAILLCDTPISEIRATIYNDTAILDTTAIPEMRYIVQNSPVSDCSNHQQEARLLLGDRATRKHAKDS